MTQPKYSYIINFIQSNKDMSEQQLFWRCDADDDDAFISLDMEQEYLDNSRSPLSVILMKDGKNMSNEFLAWFGGEDLL